MPAESSPALAGHVAVVTGGNRGIGLGIAGALAAAGADVAVWGRDERRNVEAAAELAEHGTRVLGVRCDVADEDQVIAAMATTLDELGRVDSLFANAGTSSFSPFVDLTLEAWRAVMSVNLDGAFLCLREAARHMIERGGGGALVGISSVSTVHGAPGMEHYAASKAGIAAMMKGLAVELARHGIRCNTIVPGWTETDLVAPLMQNDKFMDSTTRRTPVRRWGRPSDLGPVAVFLADPSYAFHTGDSVVVDGGYTVF